MTINRYYLRKLKRFVTEHNDPDKNVILSIDDDAPEEDVNRHLIVYVTIKAHREKAEQMSELLSFAEQ